MNSSTDKALTSTPSAVTDRSTTLPCWLRMNVWTGRSGSLIESMTWVALMCVSNLSLRKLTVRLTYFSESPSSVGDLLSDERADGDDEDEERHEYTDEDHDRRSAAAPPACASRLTPGSTASDRNNDTSSRMNSADRLLHTERVTTVTMKPSQKMASGFPHPPGHVLGRQPRLGFGHQCRA